MADATIVIAETNASVVVTSDTSATISVTETTANLTTSNVGIQGATGATGAGYSGVTSTSNLTIGTGLKTFTLVSGNSGAFVTGQRIRAIHSDTPTFWMEGYANYIGGGTLIITVDLTAGSGTHNLWNFAIAGQVGATGATGATGSSGVISVTAPITNSGTSTSAQLGFDATGFVKTSDTGTVTSTMIADGTILNADINASAGIAATKISGTAAVLGSANAFTVGGHTITNNSDVVPLMLKANATQTANLFEIQPSASATPILKVVTNGTLDVRPTTGDTVSFRNSSGSLTFWGGNNSYYMNTTLYMTGGNWASGRLGVDTANAGNIGIVVRGVASQTTDLLQLQSSTPTVLGGRNAVAQIYSGSTTTINSGVGGATTAATGNGTTATLTMTSATNLAVGDLIVVAGVTPTGYNTTGAVVTAVSNTSPFTVSYANTTSAAQTVAGTVSTPAQASITARSAGTIGAIIRGASGQSADLQQWQNSTPTTLVKIASDGHAVFGLFDTAGQVSVNPDGASRIGIRIRLASSQSSPALQVDTSTGSNLTSITAAGTLNFITGNTSATATAGAITAPALVTGYITMQVAGTTVKVPYYSN